MKTQIFLQARMGSTRTPGKTLMKIEGRSIIEILIERLRGVRNIEKIILATSANKENRPLIEEAKRLKIESFAGCEENLLDRLYNAYKIFKPDTIIRITGDCPLIDPDLVDEGIDIFGGGKYDLVSNVSVRSFPDGMDFEIFKSSALDEVWKEQKGLFQGEEEEWVKIFISPTKYIHKNDKFKKYKIISKNNLSKYRVTFDYPEDYEVIKKIYTALYGKKKLFTMSDIIEYLNKNPEVMQLNQKYVCLDYGLGN